MTTSTEFKVSVSDKSPGYNLPQKLGRRLWAPMWVMAIMAFSAAFIIGIIRSSTITDGGPETAISGLHHLQAGVMFIGFATALAAVSFAIARILGELRKGGGEFQEAAGAEVVTMEMPATARLLTVGMVTAMMTIVVASVLHLVWAGQVGSGAVDVGPADEAFIVLEAVRRIGVAVYLVSITFGLATIVEVLRFQAIRVRELVQVSSS